MPAHPVPAMWPRRLLVALGVVALLLLATLLLAWRRSALEPVQAAGPGMSLDAPDTVLKGVPFTLAVNADPALDVEMSGFVSEVLFREGLKWQ